MQRFTQYFEFSLLSFFYCEGNVNPVDILLSINLLNTDTEGYRKSPY